MPYRDVTGDLFALDLPAIGHGCNCAGLMGSGIALEFRRRFAFMHSEYRARCSRGEYHPGDVMFWEEGRPAQPDLFIFNLMTQPVPGPTATLDAIRTSVQTALEIAETEGVDRLGLPRIGCGYGGLDWVDVSALLRELGEASPVELIAVSLPIKDHPRIARA